MVDGRCSKIILMDLGCVYEFIPPAIEPLLFPVIVDILLQPGKFFLGLLFHAKGFAFIGIDCQYSRTRIVGFAVIATAQVLGGCSFYENIPLC